MVESLLEKAPSQPESRLHPTHPEHALRESLAVQRDSSPIPQRRHLILNLRFDSDWPALTGALVIGMATGFLVGWMLRTDN